MSGRCSWCGRFVKADTEWTCWRVKVDRTHRQTRWSKWNYWCRMLCPTCATAAHSGTWEPTTGDIVRRLRPDIAQSRGFA